MSNLLHTINQRIPESVRRLYAPLFRWRYSKGFTNFKKRVSLKAPLFLFKSPSSQNNITLAFVGNNFDAARRHWASLICGENAEETKAGDFWVWQIPQILKTKFPDCAMLIYDTNILVNAFFSPKPSLICARSVQMFIDFSFPLDELRISGSSGFADIQRRIRKNRLKSEVTKDKTAFDDFYHNMYLPLITSRYGEYGAVKSYNDALDCLATSELHLIKKDDQTIGAALINMDQSQPKMELLGVRDANKDYIASGAIGAMYHFSIRDLKTRGFHRLYVGGTRPFMTDPLTRFKLSLKSQIDRSALNRFEYFRMVFLKNSDSLKSFLGTHPFIFYHNNGTSPHRAFFLSKDLCLKKEKLLKHLKAGELCGCVGTHIYVLDSEEKITQAMKSGLGKDIKILPLKSIVARL